MRSQHPNELWFTRSEELIWPHLTLAWKIRSVNTACRQWGKYTTRQSSKVMMFTRHVLIYINVLLPHATRAGQSSSGDKSVDAAKLHGKALQFFPNLQLTVADITTSSNVSWQCSQSIDRDRHEMIVVMSQDKVLALLQSRLSEAISRKKLEIDETSANLVSGSDGASGSKSAFVSFCRYLSLVQV